MHEENFLSSWLREDLVGTERRRTESKRLERRKAEEEKKGGERRGENGGCQKKVCHPFTSDVFEECGPMEDSGFLERPS